MGILWRFTLRSLASNRSRTIVSIVGVVLSCALITGIFSTVSSIDHSLLLRDIELNGTWQTFSAAETDESLAELVNDPHSVNVVARRVIGFAVPDDGTGICFPVVSAPMVQKGSATDSVQGITGDVAPWPQTQEGRRPETAYEAMVSAYYLTNHDVKVGDTITLSVEQQVMHTEDGLRLMHPGTMSYSTGDDAEGSLDHVDKVERTYKIVGIYDDNAVWRPDNAGAFYTAPIFTGPATPTDGGKVLSVYATTDYHSYADISAWSDRYATRSVNVTGLADEGEKNVATLPGGSLNSELLRYQGMTDARAIWDSLWGLATVLVAVVVLASISLVYTSFAISVTERTRQFGLLRGIGASKAQLRFTVFCEALAVGLVGIPAGIGAGLIGTMLTLKASERAMAYLMDSETGITLWVSWRALLACALVTLFVLVVSAMIPALRASRASAVDAIRQSGLSASALKPTSPNHAFKEHGPRALAGRLAQRFFGASGLIAHRSLTRAGSRGRIVVASLAVSCMLVMTCGLVDSAMKPLTMIADSGTPDGTAISFSLYSQETAPTTEFAHNASELDKRICSSTDAKPLANYYHGTSSAVVPIEMLSSESRRSNEEYLASKSSDSEDGMTVSDASAWTGTVSTVYLSDTEWARVLSDLNLDPKTLAGTSTPHAIAVSSVLNSDGDFYSVSSFFGATGAIDVYNPPVYDPEDDENWFEDIVSRDGQVYARYVNYQNDVRSEHLVELDQSAPHTRIEIDALVDASKLGLPADVIYGEPLILLPESVLESVAGPALRTMSFTAYYSSVDHETSTDTAGKIVDEVLGGADWSGGFSLTDVEALRAETINIAGMMKLFALLFSVMTMLIALANVFNTLTNSIVLRTREFATLNSVGMGPRAFGRMLAYECASYAIRGLAIGFMLTAIVWYAFQYVLGLSFTEFSITVPLGYVLAAVIGAGAVLALSTPFALRRAKAQNPVEALRADAL